MKNLFYFRIFLILFATILSAPVVWADQSILTPEQFVLNIYNKNAQGKIDIFSTKNIKSIFENNLAKKIYADNQIDNPSDGDKVIDFNVLFGGQDTHVTDIKVLSKKLDGQRVTVIVLFRNSGKDEKVTDTLVPIIKSYKIYNIQYDNKKSLRELMKLN